MNKIWVRGKGKVVSASLAPRGLLTWWDKQIYSLHSPLENRIWLLIELEDKDNNETLWIGYINGPTIQESKEAF